MKFRLSFLSLFLMVPAVSSGQDLELRREAVRLMERANAVSLSPNLPDLERTDTFQVLDPNAAARAGIFTRVVVQGAGRRDEATLGDFHSLNIWTRGHLATDRTSEILPPEMETVIRLTPIRLFRFDQTDVIRTIQPRIAASRRLQCIVFDTITGQRTENNEFCIDEENGTLVSAKVGEELIENSEFFSFAGALIPAKVTYSYGGRPKLEIAQTMSELEGATANVLEAPPNTQIREFCTTFRRAIGQSMPQPKPGSGGRNTDILIRGMIGTDGKVYNAVVQSSDRPDLDAEALKLIAQWTFAPTMCNGKPNSGEASFVLHFQGR